MNLRELNYNISMDGIFPSVEQFGGTQGDHNVTSLNIGVEDTLYNSVVGSVGTGKAMYRFDVYDGEGGIWQSKAQELERNLSLTLEERHTRFGGKITIYLVITSLSEDGETEMELYSFPIELRLKNRPDGIYQDGENYESVVGLAQETKNQAEKAALSAQSAISANNEVQALVADVEEKLKNGEFDGVGVKNAEIVDDELIITYTNDTSQNLGNVKGDRGVQGEKGDKGDAGKDAVTDQTYNANSENAQSGTAVAEALKGAIAVRSHIHADKLLVYTQEGKSTQNFIQEPYFTDKIDGAMAHTDDGGNIGDDYTEFSKHVPLRHTNGNLLSGLPQGKNEVVNKKYVDDNYYTKAEIDNLDGVKYVTYKKDSEGDYIEIKSPGAELTLRMYSNGKFYIYTAHEIDVDGCRISNLELPLNEDDAATKGYVDTLVGDIETALDSIIAIQEQLIGGDSV